MSNAKELNLPGQYEIDAIGNMGFRFADMSHKGSLLILPSNTSDWLVAEGDLLQSKHFEKVIDAADNIDILILGLGNKMYMPPKDVREICKNAGIVIDFMSTSNAVRTYNVLLAEHRRIAAAFIAID